MVDAVSQPDPIFGLGTAGLFWLLTGLIGLTLGIVLATRRARTSITGRLRGPNAQGTHSHEDQRQRRTGRCQEMIMRSMQARPLRIALVGTRGVPARYGGFETCVEEVGSRLAERGHEVVVYCRRLHSDRSDEPDSYRGMTLIHHGAMKKRSLETMSHTALSVQHLVRHRTDAAVVFNAANAPFLPALRAARIPVATHVDGLEWKRDKWGAGGRRYYLMAERLAVRWSDALIADAVGIQAYYLDKFAKPTDLITYGAPILDHAGDDRLVELGLTSGGYHLVVARFEPENHVDRIVDGYTASSAELPLVVVGSAPYADAYTERVHSLADGRVTFLGGVWDQGLLDQLYANAFTYLHGHSVGGTNPSLLRALGASAPTIAYDVNFNKEVLGGAGRYFTDTAEVRVLVEESERDIEGTIELGAQARLRANKYDWDEVTDRYEELCLRLAGRDRALVAAGTDSVTTETETGAVVPMSDVRPAPAMPGRSPERLAPVVAVSELSDALEEPVRRTA
jgi:glycosyltransferase involved in cell wall biosynthesis